MDGGLFPGVARSNRKEVRNPLLTLPAAEQMRSLPPMARKALDALLRDMGRDARARAHECWRKNKAPMAAYWKAVAVYCRHAALTLNSRAVIDGAKEVAVDGCPAPLSTHQPASQRHQQSE